MARNWLIVGLSVGDAEKNIVAKNMCDQTKTLILNSFEYLKQYSNLKIELNFEWIPLDNVIKLSMPDKNRFFANLNNHLEDSLFKPISKIAFERDIKNVALILNRNRFLNHLKNESEEYKELTKELFDRIISANYFDKSDKHAVCYGGSDMDLFTEDRTALDCAAKVCCDCENKFVCTHTCYWRFLLRVYRNKEKIKKLLPIKL